MTCLWLRYVQVQNPHNIKYNGTVQGLKYIWRTEGLRGLFKGNGTNCARNVPNSAVKFFSYEQASKYVFLPYKILFGLLYCFFFCLGFHSGVLLYQIPIILWKIGFCSSLLTCSFFYMAHLNRVTQVAIIFFYYFNASHFIYFKLSLVFL